MTNYAQTTFGMTTATLNAKNSTSDAMEKN
jgi:hypothetical protein